MAQPGQDILNSSTFSERNLTMETAIPRGAITNGTNRKTAILVGVLFLSSTATFAIGSSLIAAHFSGDGSANSLIMGIFLQAYTGLAVAAIGIAMLPLLKQHHLQLARAYLALRVLECIAIIGVGAYMLLTQQPLQHYDLLIYAFTASGGIIFSYLLWFSSLIPRWLAGLGLIGYVVLALSIPTALLGLADLNAGWGMVFFVPGGLFELILPLLLFVTGFQVAKASI
jgi:hypothetical protein